MKKTIFSLFLLILFQISAHANITYYLDTAGGSMSNDGRSELTAWSDPSKITNLPVGSDVAVKRGTTLKKTLTINWTGTVDDPVLVHTYGAGAAPIWDGSETLSGSWSRYNSTSIYYATLTTATKVLLIDGSRIKQITWNTNIATTAATMSAGTFTHDATNNLVYVWTPDGTSPSSHAISYGERSYGIYAVPPSGKSYAYIGVTQQSFQWFNVRGAQIGDYDSSEHVDGLVFIDNDIKGTGSSGVRLEGDKMRVLWNRCSDSNTETNSDSSCMMLNHSDGAEIAFNQVTNTRNGSCYEIDFQVTNSRFHDNVGLNCTHQFLEVWDQSNGNKIYNNYGNSAYYSKRALQGVGIKVTKNSDNNDIFNNVMVGFIAAGYKTGATSGHGGNDSNRFHHNTYIDYEGLTGYSGKGYCFGTSQVTEHDDYNNEFKNNLCVSYNGNRMVYFDNNTSVSDGNLFYTSGSFGLWNNSATETFADFKTASGQDSHSIWGDPLIITDYRIGSSSPAFHAGVSSFVTDDIRGNPRPAIPSIGAFEPSDSSWDVQKINVNGVNIK